MKGKAGLLAGGIALLLRFFLEVFPQLAEQWYSRGFYLLLRKGLHLIFGYLPFAGVYVLGMVLLIWGIQSARRLYQYQGSWMQKTRKVLLATANFAGFVVFAFYFLWGYNYNRLPVEQQLGLRLEPLKQGQIERKLKEQTIELSRLRAALPAGPVTPEALGATLEPELREGLEKILEEHGFPAHARVRARWIRPDGLFLRFSTAGLYLPFTGEGHVDPGLAPVQWPAVMAHELAHGYGFGDEGVCSFWALLTCRASANPYLRYAGALSYWRSLASAYRDYDPEGFLRLRDQLPEAVLADLQDIRKAMQRFPDLVPRLQYRVYDAYLKSQGIGEGMLNYDRVLVLMAAYDQKFRKW